MGSVLLKTVLISMAINSVHLVRTNCLIVEYVNISVNCANICVNY